jgi:hypothetical protein
LNLQNSFEDRRALLPSFYWLIHFSDLHRTPLKNGRQLLAAFQKSCAKIWEKYEPKGRKRLKFKTEYCMHSLSSTEFVNSKAFGVKRQKTYKVNITLKGEFKKY